jgi:predicted nucleotidyltransferase
MERFLTKTVTESFCKDTGFDFTPNSFLVCRAGSVTHGTQLETSDTDFIGVVMPPVEWILGLHKFDHWEHKNPDVKVYSLSKYIRLLLKGNPAVIETLWLNDKDYCRVDTANDFLMLRMARDMFSSCLLGHAIIGYAKSRLDSFDLWDSKDKAHLIRLLRMGVEFFKTGQLVVYRPDAEELKSIKLGLWSDQQIKEEATRLLESLRMAMESTSVPSEPQHEKVERFLVSTLVRKIEAETAVKVLML